MSSLNRRRFTVTNTPGTSGIFTVGPAVSPSLGLDSTHDGLSMDVTIDEGSSWEIRRACTYTHSGTTLSRGTLEDSSTGSAISFTSAAVVRVVATAARMAAGQLVDVPYATAVKFDGQRQMAQTTVTGAIAFTVNTSNAIDGAVTQVDLIANGTNAPTFSSDFREWGGSMGYDNRSGYRNCLTMFRRASVYWYSWAQAIGATAEASPATAITMSGPSSGVVSVASTNFTIGANGSITGSIVVTPSSGGGGGTFTPSTVAISSGSPTATFTYTPASTGAKTISVTNDAGLTNPSAITYTSNASATAPGTVQSLAAGTVTGTSIPLTWAAPSSDGGSAITDYVVQWSLAGAGSWTTFADGTSATTGATVTGLTASTAYDLRVAAVNAVGTGSYVTLTSVSTGSAAMTVLRITTLSNVTETGDGTAGWNYEPTTTWATAYGISTVKIPAGQDGTIRCTVGHAIAASRSFAIALKNSATNGNNSTFSYGIAMATDYAQITAGTFIAISSPPAAVTGDLIEMVKTGTTVVGRKSSNGGSTWTTLMTWTGVPDVDYYVGIGGSDTVADGVLPKLSNMRQSGLS